MLFFRKVTSNSANTVFPQLSINNKTTNHNPLMYNSVINLPTIGSSIFGTRTRNIEKENKPVKNYHIDDDDLPLSPSGEWRGTISYNAIKGKSAV